MSRRSKETLAVQLFPFLAVLVCTMGALIFLLLVTTREIRQRVVAFAAFQRAEQEQSLADRTALPLMRIADPDPQPLMRELPASGPTEPQAVVDDGYELARAQRERELSDLKATWRQQTNRLGRDRNEQLGQVEQRKSLAEAAEAQTRQLQSEVHDLELQLGIIAGATAAAETLGDDTERILIEQQIAQLKKRLLAAQLSDSTQKNDQYQVIPFDSQTGTTRRPILIECTAAGIRFLPEDILITAKDMEGFNPKVNPLAVGTAALINYWTAWNLNQRHAHAEAEPYVLLLVRPDGVFAYYVALKMLEPIRTPQGYELIEETTELKLPSTDLGAKMACQTAIDRLLSEREKFARATGRSGAAKGLSGASPNQRGDSAGSQARGDGRDSQTGADRPSRSNGNQFSMNDIQGGEETVGSRSWERIENFQGKPRAGRRTESSMGTGDWETADRTSGPQGSAAQGSFARGSTSRGSTSQGSAFDGSAPRDETPFDPADSTGSPVAARKSPATEGQRNSSLPRNGLPGKGNSSGSEKSRTIENAYLQEGADEFEPGMPIGERPGRKPKRKPANSEGMATDAGQNGEVAGDWETAEDSAGVPQDIPQNGGAAGHGTRSRDSDSSSSSSRFSDNSSSASRFSHQPNSATRAARPGETPSKSSDQANKPLEPEMLAGHRWGLCDPGAGIGFEREVRVDVAQDELRIAEKHSVRVGQGESKQETLEMFAAALDQHSRTWGRPPQGFFWAPRLKFVVKPNANGQYEQVNAMMTRAGLATSHEFAEDPKGLQFGRTTPALVKPAAKTAFGAKSGARQ
jgi:hypothetical protein